jgi:hypothetical protein
MKYYSAAEAPQPELLNSLRAASKLAPLKHLMLLFLHFIKKFNGFYARLLHNISQQSKFVMHYRCTYRTTNTDVGKYLRGSLSLTWSREYPGQNNQMGLQRWDPRQ